jgi:phage-related tail protein
MADKFDGQQVLAFLRRTGEELREEAQKLLDDVRDPAHQQRVKDGIKDLGAWFKRTTSEAAEMIEGAAKRAESTLRVGADRVRQTATAAAATVQEVGAKAAPRSATAGKRAGARKSAKPRGKKTARRVAKKPKA